MRNDKRHFRSDVIRKIIIILRDIGVFYKNKKNLSFESLCGKYSVLTSTTFPKGAIDVNNNNII